jgi:hypothetical protein
LLIPVTAKIIRITLSSLPDEQRSLALEISDKMRYLQAFGNVLVTLITILIYSFILWILTLLAKPSLTFIKSFRLIIYSYFVLVIGDFINSGLLYIRGLDKITTTYDISLTGLNVFTSLEKSGVGLYQFLSYVNPFQVWFVILVSIGLSIFTDSKYIKSLIICFIFWILTLIYPVCSAIYMQDVISTL